jgi:acetyltransferase-like isoleucine patch superfamily enzyme
MIDATAFIHKQALVDEGARVGARSRVWAFSHILPGAVVGEDCNICDHTFIEGKVVVGNRVTIKCGVYLWDGMIIDDDVFIGPAAVFTNDLRPRSKQYPEVFVGPRLSRGCSIGANATILPQVKIGRWSMVGAGSVVTRDVPANALVAGNPARIRGWLCRCSEPLDFAGESRYICHCGLRYRLAEGGMHVEEL